MKKKIYYHHTDCGGVVYYATYLEFLEEARTEFLARKGIDTPELLKQGRLFVVSHQEVDYKAPASYGDTLEITTKVTEVSGVRIYLEHEVIRPDHSVAVKARTTLACVDTTLRPRPLPAELLGKIKA